MKISDNLNKAIESHIEENLAEYIQFGEYDPTLNAISNAVRLIHVYSDPGYIYKALDGDPEIANDLYLLGFEREYYSQTPMLLAIRRKLIAHASRVLSGYEHIAWQLWERRNIEPANPSEPDINVTMPNSSSGL